MDEGTQQEQDQTGEDFSSAQRGWVGIWILGSELKIYDFLTLALLNTFLVE